VDCIRALLPLRSLRLEPFKDEVSLVSLQADLDGFKDKLIDTAIVNECNHMADVQDQMDADIAQVRTTTGTSRHSNCSKNGASKDGPHHEKQGTAYANALCV
jgi:hypothetical protein